MGNEKKVAIALLAALAWGVLGVLMGLGAGYFSYVKTPATFETSAKLQITSSSQQTDVDDSALIMSEAVLTDAVSTGRLTEVPPWHGVVGGKFSRNQVAESLGNDGDLSVSRVTSTTKGALYQVTFRGRTPKSTQQVVDEVVAAAQRTMQPAGDQEQWRDAIDLLREEQGRLSKRRTDLESQLQELSVPDDAILDDQQVVSATAEKRKHLQVTAEELREQQALLHNKIRQTEAMIAEGVPAEDILVALGQPLKHSSRSGPVENPATSAEQEIAKAREERNRKIAERVALERQVEQELRPLQEELDKLLERLGSGHPTVRGVRDQMTRVRAKLKDLPPLEPDPTETTQDDLPSGDSDSSQPQNQPEIEAQRVARLLRALRSEKKLTENQLDNVMTQLENSIKLVARQEAVLIQREQLQSELSQLTELGDQLVARLKSLSAAPPVISQELTVVQPALPGIQTAPELQEHLVWGGFWGTIGGGVVAILLLLVSLATRQVDKTEPAAQVAAN